jgi:hypothetical protein
LIKRIVARITALLMAVGLMFTPVSAYAASSAVSDASVHQVTVTQSRGVSAHAIAFGGYRSGFRSPSSRVGSWYGSRTTRPSYGTTAPHIGATGGSRSFGGGFGSHLFSFGAGWLLGSMFHPFGGYYGWGAPMAYHGFSLFGLIFDLLILWILWRIVKRLLFRR